MNCLRENNNRFIISIVNIHSTSICAIHESSLVKNLPSEVHVVTLKMLKKIFKKFTIGFIWPGLIYKHDFPILPLFLIE